MDGIITLPDGFEEIEKELKAEGAEEFYKFISGKMPYEVKLKELFEEFKKALNG
jgi:hypothetical protein